MDFSNNKTPDVARAFLNQARTYLSDDYLPKIERCLQQLTDDQIWFRSNAVSNSIGNLVLHLCGNATQWILSGLGGKPDHRDRDSEFLQREIISRDDLLENLRVTITEVATVLDSMDQKILLENRIIQGNPVDVLEAVFHVTEHFSMHTGQIILLTKILAEADLEFYDFSSGAPVINWDR